MEDTEGELTRLNLKVQTRVRDTIERLQRERGLSSMTEVIRRATDKYWEVVMGQKDGSKLILRCPEGKEKIVIIL